MAAFALEIEHGVDHVLDHARTRDLPLLGDVADQDDGRAGRLGVADDALGGGPYLRDRAGGRFGEVGPQRLDGIEDDEVRPPALAQRRQDVLDIGLGGEFHRRGRRTESLRAQPDLRHGLLAGDVDDPMAAICKRRRRLHQQRRLADAGIAADQHGRAAHEAAARGTVELGDAGDDARRILDLPRQGGECHRPALAGRAQGTRNRTDAAGAFLDQRVPGAAGLALARPARRDVAAGLADELDAGLRQG